MKHVIMDVALPLLIGMSLAALVHSIAVSCTSYNEQKKENATLSDKLKKCERSNKNLAKELESEKVLTGAFIKLLQKMVKGSSSIGLDMDMVDESKPDDFQCPMK